MPSISTGKVLVSGANGYVALWVVASLLKRGFSVRGTIRSAKKSQHILETFKSYGNKLEIAVVEDITKEGAFDEAVKGVDAILHMASPFTMKATKVEDFVPPAVEGTVGILRSATKHSEGIKRIVVTSSVASIIEVTPVPSVYTEEDWNNQSAEEVKLHGDEAGVAHLYLASKTLAEKAAWDYYASVKNTVSWDLVTILPGLVFGPLLQEVTSPSQLNESMETFYTSLMTGTAPEATKEQVLSMVGPGSWVDVRDVAEAHASALTIEEAKGQRFLVVTDSLCTQDIVNTAHRIDSKIPNHFPELEIPPALKQFDASKSQKVLGLKYRSLEETTRDILEEFTERKWIHFGLPRKSGL